MLHLQIDNEGSPDWLRVQPGEFVQVEGDEEGRGVKMPEVSHRWLDGLWVYENMANEMPPHEYVNLEDEVLYIFAAKQDKVLVRTLLREYEDIVHRHRAPLDGLAVARHFDPEDIIPGYTLLVRLVPLDGLTPDDVDEELIASLEHVANEGNQIFVIEDSEHARAALEKRLDP